MSFSVVAGFGATASASWEDLADALSGALVAVGLSQEALVAFATCADKYALLQPFAAQWQRPLYAVVVRGVKTPTQSPYSLQAQGTGSVAEAAALSAGGGALLAPRYIASQRRATCALAYWLNAS
ncbi:hypothetical protein BFW38_14750 [Terasakiispira papahanaumokuakeensis]|uniref:CobE/GbiG C-terminal domain-containing protein n=2 Tax=Terasakiispira papahanaumokuakeensis TaxID=197479 RepID=A0A1E2VES0_9GAMM|nr:hypothetical protein BFW38_14750 [Terasakiispira papahanaumokuakeensis]